VAVSVEELVNCDKGKTRFREEMNRFCILVRDWCMALMSSAKEAANNPVLQEKKPRGHNWEWEWLYVAGTRGELVPRASSEYIAELKSRDKAAFKENTYPSLHGVRLGFWRKKLPANPCLWWPYIGICHWLIMHKLHPSFSQRKPDSTERLMMKYVLLSVVHDGALPDTERQCLNILHEPQIKALNDGWATQAWKTLLWDENTESAEGDKRRAEILCAFTHVCADLKVPANLAQANGRQGSQTYQGIDGAGNSQRTNRVHWNDGDPTFITNTEAMKMAKKTGCDNDMDDLQSMNLDRLKKLLRSPRCMIRYMSKTKPPRGRVHKGDFEAYLNNCVAEKKRIDQAVERETIRRLQ